MEAIIDGLESLVYGNPCEGKESVDETHRVIATNIDGEDIDSRIQKAQVVIFLQRDDDVEHSDQKNRNLDGRVIRNYWNPSDRLLANRLVKVGGPEPRFYQGFDIGYLPFSIRSHVQSWETGGIPDEEKEILKHWHKLVTEFEWTNILLYLSITGYENAFIRFPRATQPLIELLYAENWKEHLAPLSNLSKMDEVAQFKTFIERHHLLLKEVEEKYMQLLQEHTQERNASLAQSIHSAAAREEKTWVVMKESDGRYMHSLQEKGVSQLYESLEAEKINYVVLKSFDEYGGALAHVHDKAYIPEIEKIKKSSLDQALESLRADLKAAYPSDDAKTADKYVHTRAVVRSVADKLKSIDDSHLKLLFRGMHAQFLLEQMQHWK